MTPQEWEACKIRPLPTTMTAALDHLEASPVILPAMQDLLARCYIKVRRSEAEAFAAQDVDFEIRHHLYRF
jgi:glutamine synthetase